MSMYTLALAHSMHVSYYFLSSHSTAHFCNFHRSIGFPLVLFSFTLVYTNHHPSKYCLLFLILSNTPILFLVSISIIKSFIIKFIIISSVVLLFIIIIK